jgi:hypothetical protein
MSSRNKRDFQEYVKEDQVRENMMLSESKEV